MNLRVKLSVLVQFDTPIASWSCFTCVFTNFHHSKAKTQNRTEFKLFNRRLIRQIHRFLFEKPHPDMLLNLSYHLMPVWGDLGKNWASYGQFKLWPRVGYEVEVEVGLGRAAWASKTPKLPLASAEGFCLDKKLSVTGFEPLMAEWVCL